MAKQKSEEQEEEVMVVAGFRISSARKFEIEQLAREISAEEKRDVSFTDMINDALLKTYGI